MAKTTKQNNGKFNFTDYHSFATSFKIGNTQFDVFCDSTFLDNADMLHSIKDEKLNARKIFHNHSYNEFIFTVKGPIDLQTEEDKISLGNGAVCLLPKKYMHLLRLSSECIYYAIGFTYKKVPEKNKFLNTFDKFDNIFLKRLILPDQRRIINITQEIKSFINKPSEFSYFIIVALLQLLILVIYENSLSITGKLDEKGCFPVIADINHIINQRINNINSDAKLKDIAEEVYISKRQLSRIIKKQYGVTYTERKTQLRIESAKLLLKNTDLSLEKIAERCSFYDTGTLIKKFTEHTGMSPTRYRTNYNNRPYTDTDADTDSERQTDRLTDVGGENPDK